jgi:hypothetical protein
MSKHKGTKSTKKAAEILLGLSFHGLRVFVFEFFSFSMLEGR